MNHSFTSIEGLKNVFFNKAPKLTARILFTGILFFCLIYNSYAAPIIVSSCTQYGAGSIDAAITAANGNVNLDTIVFTCNSITLNNKLYISNPVIIEGYTALAPECGPGTRTELIYNGGGIAIHINNTTNVTIRGLVISGTGISVGIEIDGSTNCKIEGNYIGITANGLALANPAIRNNSQAIWLQGGSGHTIGGATCRERNVVSNYNMCVEIKGSTNATVINNYLGTDYLGKNPLIDGTYTPAPYTVEYNSFGVHVIDGSNFTKVLNNVIGSRRKYGIFFDKTNNNSNPGNDPIIRGNLVGIGTDSLTKMGNGWAGIFLHRSQRAAIGGPNAADRNYTGNNGYLPQGNWETTGSGHGIQLTELAGASNIENNVAGLSQNGKTPMPNAQDGISLLGSSNNTIKNNISQWNTYGIFLQGLTDYGQAALPIKDACNNNKIIGNIVKYNGYNPQNPTEGGGIALQFSASNNRIGIDSIGLGNVADSNLTGITLRNDRINSGLASLAQFGASNNRIYNNRVINSTSVTDVSKIKYTDMLGVGIVVHGNGSDNNFIGGSQPLQANTITMNASNGIYIETGVKNWVFPQNKITCNGGAAGAQGIRLAAKPTSAGVIGNNNYGSTSPVAGHVTVNAPNTGSADASDSTGVNYEYKGYAPASSIVYIYLADACYSCSTPNSNGLFKQGETLIDSVFANASGIWTYSLAKPVGNGIVVYAAETSGTNRNTSELSQCYFPACIPPATAVISPANPATVCKGTDVTLTANLENTYIYTWYKGTTVVSGPSLTNTYAATATGSYTVRIADPSNPDNPLCYRTSAPVTVTVDSSTVPGTIGSNQSICNGVVPDPFTSIKDATGGSDTPSYLWQSSTDNITFSNINSATTATYASPALTATTYFRRSVTAGTCSATYSDTIKITIDSVSEGGSISGEKTVCSGVNNGTLTLNGHVGVIQKWESSTDSFNTVTPINITGNTHSFTDLTATTKFRVIVKSGACSSDTSLIAAITVDSASNGGSISGGKSVCSGVNNGTLILNGKVGTVLNWESSTNNFTTVTNIPNATTSYSYSNIPVTTQFRAIVQSGTCSSDISLTATITVDPVSDGGSITGGNTVCAVGNNGTLNLINTVGDVINWESSIDDFTTVSTISNTTKSHTYTNLPATTKFRAIIKSGSCLSAISTQATITVDAASGGGSATASIIEACGNLPSTSISLNGQTGTSIQWQTSANNISWSDIPGATTSPYTATNLTATTYFRAKVKSGVCDSATSSVATITISDGSKGGTATAALSPICQNNSTSVSLTGYNGNSIQWQQSVTGNSNWTNVTTGTNATTATYTTPNLTATTYYRAIVKNGSCDTSGSSIDMVAVLAVPPFKLGADTLICEGTDMKLMAPSGFQKYAWSNGSTNQAILIAASGLYWVKAETSTGCPVADSIKINECNKLTIPNVYTPNGDPLNQTFTIQGNRPNSNLEIYNRWGLQVYSSSNYNNTWDGQGCTDGVYYYIYKRPIDQKSLHGWVEIIRD